MILTSHNWRKLLSEGFELRSSGTTGISKSIFQPPEKLAAANRVALEAQKISRHSRVLTVCSMDHAGGVLAQTLPALTVGAEVVIKPFNAFSFWRDINSFTHTHLTPAHCDMLMRTRSFSDARLDGLFVTCGSDNVSFDIIEAFVERGATFMCNWGMTEVGPVAINSVFSSVREVADFREDSTSGGTLMGDRYYCDCLLKDTHLYVRGEICVYDDWFDTRDIVMQNAAGAMFHLGRFAGAGSG